MSVNLARIVLRLLRDPHGWSFESMERELGISDRTRRKYIQQLRDDLPELGEIRVVRQGDRHVVILSSDAPQHETSHEAFLAQRIALALSESALRGVGLASLAEAIDEITQAQRRWTSAQRELSRDLRERPLPCCLSAPLATTLTREIPVTVLTTLIHSVVFRRPLRLVYRPASRGGAPQAYEIRPLAMTTFDGQLYILAYKGLDGEVRRLFRADRIDAAAIIRGADRLSPSALANVNPQDWFEGAFGPFVTDAPPREVRVRFDPEPWVLATVRERQWHPSQRTEALPDGGLLMTLRMRAIEPLRAWLGRFGPHAQLLTA